MSQQDKDATSSTLEIRQTIHPQLYIQPSMIQSPAKEAVIKEIQSPNKKAMIKEMQLYNKAAGREEKHREKHIF